MTAEASTNIKRVVAPAVAADILGVSSPTLARWRKKDGVGPRFVRLGVRRIGYRLADLNAWLESRATGGEQPARVEA
jgi:predicted DNA-binding transcriptional regulator AlpA